MISVLIVLPLTAAFLVFLWPRQATFIGLSASAATVILTAICVTSVYLSGPMHTLLGGWSPPLGIRLAIDGLSALMLSMMALVGGLLSLFAPGYFKRSHDKPATITLFWPLWLLLWGTLNGLFMAADIFTLYVLMEISLLAAVALVTLSPSQVATMAALRYLLVTTTGSLLYLMGVAILYDAYGVLDMVLLAEEVQSGWALTTALLLMTIGLMTKAALFPLHFWLPPAHALSPVPVSAILSALFVKGAFYLLLRLWSALGEQAASAEFSLVIAMLAVAAIVWGSVQALRQRHLKMLIAYSTVAQVGFFFLAFPALANSHHTGPDIDPGLAGSAIQVVAHALAKASLFLAAGILLLARHSDRLSAMRGMARSLPVTAAALALAGLGLYGPPGSGAGLGKSLLGQALHGGEHGWWEPLLTFAGLLTITYVLSMLRYIVLPYRGSLTMTPVSLWLQAIPLVLALCGLGLGWFEPLLIELLQVQSGGTE
ncbi:MAG: oxidoreductase [Halomonadaceae bacterium]|nr:MAG: oxidoreductase [Halomonadaceae bacterium]